MPDAPATRTVGPGRFGDVRRFSELDSTNRWLLEQAREGAPEGLVAVADHQTAGRGRLGRVWVAPPRSSLLVSVLLRPPLAPADAHLVTMAAGLAVVDAVATVAGFEPGLKWPNDLIANDRKLAGMLCEAVVASGRLDALVVGLGVNVEWDGPHWGELPADVAAAATACNVVAARPVDVDDLLDEWLRNLERRYGALITTCDSAPLLAEYRSRCVTLGQRVRVEQTSGDLTGTAVGVDDSGRLLVDSGHTQVAVSVGDVIHVRAAPE